MKTRWILALLLIAILTDGTDKSRVGLVAQSIPGEGNGKEMPLDASMPTVEAVGGTGRLAPDGTVLVQPMILASGLQGDSDQDSCISNDSCSQLGENSGSCRIFDASAFDIPDSKTPAPPPSPGKTEPPVEPPLSPGQIGTVSKTRRAILYAGFSEDPLPSRRLLDAAIAAKRETENQNRDDQSLVSKSYEQLSQTKFSDSLTRAMDRLTGAIDTMRLTRTGMSPGDLTRFQNLFSNARDQTQSALSVLAQEQTEESLNQIAAFKGFLDPTKANPLGRTQGLQEIFGKTPLLDRPGSQEALLQRLIMYEGLPDQEKDEIRKRLNFIETPELELSNGSKVKLEYLHNGYVWGGGKTGQDCSQLASSTLPDGLNRSNFTSLEFYMMWKLIRQNKLPNPPELTSSREQLVRKASAGFQAINIYQRQKLLPGDILTFRIPSSPGGHVFIVRSFDAKTGLVKVIEAAQSAGTVRERDYSLYVTYRGQKFIKPGFTALRMKSEDNTLCTIATAQKSSDKSIRGGT